MDPSSVEDHIAELELLLSLAKHPMTKIALHQVIQGVKVSSVKTIKPLQPPSSDVPFAKHNIQVKTYGWDQTNKNVKIYISDIPKLETISPDQLKVKFADYGVNVRILNLNECNYNFNITELSGKIYPESSKAILKRSSIIITMPKVAPFKWAELTMAERKSKWSMHEKDRMEDPALQGETDPNVNLQKMMQKMYEEGNDEMKRTIAKTMFETRTGKAPNPMEYYA